MNEFATMRPEGKDITELLDYIPSRFDASCNARPTVAVAAFPSGGHAGIELVAACSGKH